MSERAEQRRQIRREVFSHLPVCRVSPLPDDFLDDILREGLIIVGTRGTGKSNVAKVILSEIINNQENNSIQCKVTDTCQNWVHCFEPIWYQRIAEDNLMHHRMYWGEDHILYDLELPDVDAIQNLVGTMVSIDSEVQRRYKAEGLMDTWVLWTIEEAQNMLGTYALNGKAGKKWLKQISESRNFNINFIFIGQRLADISTKAVERCGGYLFGRLVGDNDLKKVKKICGKDNGIENILPKLGMGEFIHWNGLEARLVVDVPKYECDTKPIMWRGSR